MYKLDTTPDKQPYILANFAITLDGKVAGTRSPYWPVASRLDFEVLEKLRAQVDVLIHGKNTAIEHEHGKFLNDSSFNNLRAKYGKNKPYTYIVVSAHPDQELIDHLTKSNAVHTILATTEEAEVPDDTGLEIWRCGSVQVDVNLIVQQLKANGLNTCMVEGGPTLFGSFVAANLIDELFLTVAPKLIGSGGTMLSLMEGIELLPEEVKSLQLLEVNQEGNELYLRYKFNK